MSMINFMNYSLSTAAEGFVPSHIPLKKNKHLNIPFQSTHLRRGKNKSESQGLTPSSQVCACGTRRGSWGRASILSVMPKRLPTPFPFLHLRSLPTLLRDVRVLQPRQMTPAFSSVTQPDPRNTSMPCKLITLGSPVACTNPILTAACLPALSSLLPGAAGQ